MLKISDFARLSQVSVRTLRYYDELGLLKPVHVDRFTDYRYYSVDQLPRLHRILALKDLGFSLDHVARLLTDDVTPAQIRGVLRMKQAELRQRVQDEQERLARVETRLRQMELQHHLPEYDIVLKKVEPQTVAALREVIPAARGLDGLFEELERYLRQHGVRAAGFPLTLWHESDLGEQWLDAEVAVPITAALPAAEHVAIYTLPGHEWVACAIQHGSYETLDQATCALYDWIAANGYRSAGPSREVYLRFGLTGEGADYPEYYLTDNPNDYVTEVQIPVEKA